MGILRAHIYGRYRVYRVNVQLALSLECGEINITSPSRSIVVLCMHFSEICVLARQGFTIASGRVGHIWSIPGPMQSPRVPNFTLNS